MSTLRTTLISGLIGLSLCLGACDKGDAKPDGTKTAANESAAAKKADDAKPDDAKPDDAKPDDAEPDDAEPDDAEPDVEEFDERVVKAVELANKIEADPSKSDEILAEAGMDRAAFDALIHEVSTPELAEQYRLARAQAEG